IGKTIENQDALELGKLKDVILDEDTGRPIYGIVSSGGIAGLKPRRRLVPAAALSLASAKRGVLYMDVPLKKWAEAPDFKKSELPQLGTRQKLRQIYAFYGITFRDSPAAEPAGKPGAARLTRTGPDTKPAAADANLQRASAIIGEAV